MRWFLTESTRQRKITKCSNFQGWARQSELRPTMKFKTSTGFDERKGKVEDTFRLRIREWRLVRLE